MYSVFEELLNQSGEKAVEVAKATKIPQSTFSDWKKGKSSPKIDKLNKLANHFGVPVTVFTQTDSSENVLFDSYYNNNREKLTPFFSKYIRLKRINADMTEKQISSLANVDLDRYIKFESENLVLPSADLYNILCILNTDMNYLSGMIYSLLFSLKSIADSADSDQEKDYWNNLFMKKYDLYEIEKTRNTKQ